MASPQIFIVNRDNSPDAGLLATFGTPGSAPAPRFVAGDANLQIGVRPVSLNNKGETVDAYEAGDRIFVGIGEINAPATGGTYTLGVGLTTPTLTTSLAYNVSAAALQTALNAAATTEGAGSVTVTADSVNSYFIKANAVGAYSISLGANNLTPVSTIEILIFNPGSGSAQAEFYLTIKQSFLAFSELTNASNSVPTLTATITQAGTATANKIYALETNASSGTFRISASIAGTQRDCGTVSATASVSDVGFALIGHPSISNGSTATAANVKVTKILAGWQVEFIGTLAVTNTPTITVTANSDLAAPKYLFGPFGLDNQALIRYFSTNTLIDEADFPFSISAWRGAEKKTILQSMATIARGAIPGSSTSNYPSLNLLLQANGYTSVSTAATSTTLTFPATSISQDYVVTYTGGAGAFAVNLPSVASFLGSYVATVRVALPATAGVVLTIVDGLTAATLLTHTSDGSGGDLFARFVAIPASTWVLTLMTTPT